MIALAVVAMGFAANAATVSWTISSTKIPADANGTYHESTTVGKAGQMAIYLVNAEDFANATAENIFANYSTKTADYGSLTGSAGATSMGNLTLTSGNTYKANDDVYAIMIVSYTDADKKQWYVANKAQVKIAESLSVAQDAVVQNMNTIYGGAGDVVNFGGTFGSDITGWASVPSDVPEPTSGLLLLLGVAGLALRRKQK